MSQIVDRTFEGGSEPIDGNEYVRCKFIRSTFVYSGGEVPTWRECQLTDVQWTFADAAKRTLDVLSMLYQYGDPGTKQSMEGLFDRLRGKQ